MVFFQKFFQSTYSIFAGHRPITRVLQKTYAHYIISNIIIVFNVNQIT